MERKFNNIQIVDVDTSTATFKNWPAQLENINLEEIHTNFLKDCSTKYRNLISNLRDRTIWMINSTAVGGGVAEMLPMLIGMFKDINIKIKWVVISPTKNEYEEAFFNLTKQMHNNIHGVFNPQTMQKLTDKHRNILENVCYDNAKEFIPLVGPQDIIIIHDPQPLAMIKYIKKELNNSIVWRCHVGVDTENQVTNDTWQFLKRYIQQADHIIFSVKDYIPKYVLQSSQAYSVIPPAICPFTPKNIGLSSLQMMDILSKSAVIHNRNCKQQWQYTAQRVCGKTGKLVPCSNAQNTNFELLFNPVLCEISRWDALKGWNELIEAFVYIKQNLDKFSTTNDIFASMILVLAGPDPKFIQDDPEGVKVFADLCSFYQSLGEKYKSIQDSIYILSIPMDNTDQNAFIVNALQRLSSIVIQNSLMEGFGLTVTEAMYKGTPMIASNVGGIKTQVFHKANGIVIYDPNDYKSVARAINLMVENGSAQMIKYAIAGKKSVINNFLIWSQCRNYMDMLSMLMAKQNKRDIEDMKEEYDDDDKKDESNVGLQFNLVQTLDKIIQML